MNHCVLTVTDTVLQCRWMCMCLFRQKKQREIERQDDEVKCSEVAEKTLFHGIKWKHLHSVCRSNIDWRTMGFSHGVMFGEGESTASYLSNFW